MSPLLGLDLDLAHSSTLSPGLPRVHGSRGDWQIVFYLPGSSLLEPRSLTVTTGSTLCSCLEALGGGSWRSLAFVRC